MLGRVLRKKSSGILDSIGQVIGKSGVNPNHFSMIALFWAGFAAYFLFRGDYLLGLIFVIMSTLWDAIDGSVARSQKRASKFGNYFDAMLDKYVEVIIYFGLALGGYAIEAFLVISGSLILSYAKPRTAMVVKIDNHDWPAIGERPDRILVLILALVITIFIPSVIFFDIYFSTLSLVLYLLAGIVIVGGIQRINYAKSLIVSRGIKTISGKGIRPKLKSKLK